MYNLLIGGAAGQGIETTSAILEKAIKRAGYSVFTSRDFMSRVRGGHNFTLIRFGTEPVYSHSYTLDGIIALNDETVDVHRDKLRDIGFILCDSKLTADDPRCIKIPLEDLAKGIGNPRVSGTIAVGVILKLFGIKLDRLKDVLSSFIKESYVGINMKAAEVGYEQVESRYSLADGSFGGHMIINGNKSLALGAIAAGLRFYSAYPMSPSTSIMEYLASRANAAGIVVEQAEDEISAINMAIGASFAGARAMTGTSGGGFSLMVEALGLSGMAEIPLVVVDVQRPGPVTGLPTRTEQSDLKFVISASQGEFPRMVIALRNHTDAFYQTIRAFEIAEKYQIPVIILSDQYLADASATVAPFVYNSFSSVNTATNLEISDSDEYLRYKITENGISPRLIPGRTKHLVSADSDEHDERGWITESAEVRTEMMNKRMRKLVLLKEELQEPEFIGPEAFDILLVGWGSVYGPVSEAVGILNRKTELRYSALIFGDVYPLPQKLLREKAAAARKIINVEQNATGQLADLIREQTGIVCSGSFLKYDGRQMTADEIIKSISEGGLM